MIWYLIINWPAFLAGFAAGFGLAAVLGFIFVHLAMSSVGPRW